MKSISILWGLALLISLFTFSPVPNSQVVNQDTLTRLIENNTNLIKVNNETLKECMDLHIQPQVIANDTCNHKLIVVYKTPDQQRQLSGCYDGVCN